MNDPDLPPADSVELLYCPGCGYDLRNISSARCPECGLTIDFSAVSPIPWCHRRRIGRLRAFCRTVWLATVHPRKIAAAVAGPVDERSANRFRWIVIAVAALPLIVVAIGGFVWLNHTGALSTSVLPPDDLHTGTHSMLDVPAWEASLLLYNGITFWPAACIGIVMTLGICTRAGSFWFRGPSSSPVRRQRNIAISSYAAAPLVFLYIPTMVILGVAVCGEPNPAIRLLNLTCVLAPFFLFWLGTLRLLRCATHCGAGKVIAAGISLPILWAIAAVIGLGLFPALIGLLRIMIQSLR